ncbi:MAG: alpha/beta hydrolase family protein [Alistipes sp.]|nr:alpha/beta hydrolase family protein [Alistipes sp.]
MIRKLVFALALYCLGAGTMQAASVDTLKVNSPSMHKKIQVLAIVPDGARKPVAKDTLFPVLYLLHGHSGDAGSWLSIQPNLPAMAEQAGVIVVCPDAQNSWYMDSPIDSTVRYETFVSKELMEYIDRHYPTRADRSGRAISGLSMGGHGAYWLALRHKDRYGAAGTTSGGVDFTPFPNNWNLPDLLGDINTYPDHWKNFTVINQLDRISNGDLALIIDCGYDDFFFEVNRNLHDQLRARGIDHDYIVRPGAHNVPYWNNALDYQWVFFNRFFRRAQ